MMLPRLIARLRESSSLAGLAAVAILAGQGADDARAWSDALALVLGVAAVLVPESGKP